MPFSEIGIPKLKDEFLISIREKYQEHYKIHYGDDKKGLYNQADWRRLQYASELIPENVESILDVGVGPGAFLNFLTMKKYCNQVVGVDIRKYSKFISLVDDLDFKEMSVDKLDFEDNSFDTVFCMEVLEHLPVEVMLNGIAELKRVTRHKLVMSVPFEEPLPLPSYHLQRFDIKRLELVFPGSDITLLHRPNKVGWPWAFITILL